MPSTLVERLTRYFDSAVRNRGQQYYRTGEVQKLHVSTGGVTAEVWGSEVYDVALDFARDTLTIDCTCPYFADVGPCKHLWATILAADAKGYLALLKSNVSIEVGNGVGDWDEGDIDPLPPAPSPSIVRPMPLANWRTQISAIVQPDWPTERPREWPAKRQIVYLVDVAASTNAEHLVVSVQTRDRKKDGSYGRLLPLAVKRFELATLPLDEDRAILSALAGAQSHSNLGYYYGASGSEVGGSYTIPASLLSTLVPNMVRTGRCYLVSSRGSADPLLLAWDDGEPWRFELQFRVEGSGTKAAARVIGVLRRDQQTIDISAPALVSPGFIFRDHLVAPLSSDTASQWLLQMRKLGSIRAPASESEDLLVALLCSEGLPPLDLPEEFRYEQVSVTPRPRLRIGTARDRHPYARLPVEILFDYDGRLIQATDRSRGVYDRSSRRFLLRDQATEQAAVQLVRAAGAKPGSPTFYQPEPGWDVAASKVPKLTRDLLLAGWHVEAEGKALRRPGNVSIKVTSGIDWFELTGTVEYGNTTAKLPALLAALRRGETLVELGDGSYGMLPEEWLRRIGMLAGMGTAQGDEIRFRQNQAGLLDALLAAQPEAQFDSNFARIREQLLQFQGVDAAPQPDGFVGQLRDYQREGLGWMNFLRQYGFGGCLADDMGVGKTAQVLALLEKRRELRVAGKLDKPSLAVVPRSLIFNWKQEAERFTPALRVLDYTGTDRSDAEIASNDLVLTTYGTLRRDAARMKDVEFDYVVLDEAQSVKNSSSESAKAVRLLKGDHRLALSGTPVENHLGELWSLFEFLNPGMLGAASIFKGSSSARRTIDSETRSLLAHALRPFILRRTKSQVARELPPKTEQTVYCELEPAQRKLYNELRQHYRSSLLTRVDQNGLNKNKFMVLEALLRLRQAACHPGLVDGKRIAEPSAKLEALGEELREVLDSGHKALVFSQFTSLLAIVRERLDSEGVLYEYLDGQTRDRQERVERFQNDPDCGVFLVSLKAGGLGLNLTAAEYVFLLDPWWNPAVEAQAVDRAHRIGQTRPVFAYRLIARDTVEEKVLELQKSKRDLADAILGEDNALIRDLRREDLELLLS